MENLITIASEVSNFGIDIVSLSLSWTQRTVGALYNVTVIPQAEMNFTEQTTIQLTLSYNVIYSVTIVTIVCGQTTSTTVTQLHHGETHLISL